MDKPKTMMKIAVFSDIHGNIEALKAILSDIKSENINEIICLGDVLSLGSNPSECLKLLKDNNVKLTLGDDELYVTKKVSFNKDKDYKSNMDSIKNELDESLICYLRKCPLYYECNIDYENSPSYKLIFSYYLIDDINNNYPFETINLKDDVNLWIKYFDENKEYFIGHIHEVFSVNSVDGICGDYIEKTDTLTNIYMVGSSSQINNEATYTLIEIGKSRKYYRRKVYY